MVKRHVVLNRFLFSCILVSLSSPMTTLRAQTQMRAAVDTHSLSLPAVGDCTLLILSPSLLEFTQISTKEKDSAWVQLKSALGSRTETAPPTAPRFEVTVGGRPVKVDVVGTKRRVLYAPVARRDLRVATQFYLRLAEPIAPQVEPPIVEVRLPNGTRAKTPLTVTATFDPQRTSPAIHVNQEGYVPTLPKRAMIGYYLGDLGEMEIPTSSGFALLDARSGETVFRGTLIPRRDIGYSTSPLTAARLAPLPRCARITRPLAAAGSRRPSSSMRYA